MKPTRFSMYEELTLRCSSIVRYELQNGQWTSGIGRRAIIECIRYSRDFSQDLLAAQKRRDVTSTSFSHDCQQ